MRMYRCGWRLLVAAGLLAACGTDTEKGSPTEPVRPFTSAEAQVAGASVDFGLALLGEVQGAESAKANLMISPLSASTALGMTLNGAQGTTFDAMRRTLGFGDLTQAQVNAAYRGLLAQFRARDPKVQLALANSLWYERTFPVFSSFADTLRSAFDAEVRGLDFADPASPKTISQWAEEKTGGRIKDLVKEIAPDEVLFLVNAVYFKAPWSAPFDSASTYPADFTRLDGSTVRVPTMSRDGVFRGLTNGALSAVELLYGDSAFSMVLLAPASGHSLAPILPRLEPARWNALLDSLRVTRFLLTLPRFRFDYGTRLDPALRNLGMGIAFDRERANFGGIADLRALGRNLYISRVEQKAFIDVNESGTEAAAATAVGIGITSLPPQLRFDRPFLFAVRERSTGAILFAGRVGDPSAT